MKSVVFALAVVLTVLPCAKAQVLYNYPADDASALTTGDPLVLNVEASADPTPMYQWRRNGVPIIGATESTLVLDAVEETDWGFYSVDLISTCGIVSSDAVPVRVMSGPDACP